jgi:hypothetical protein
MIIRPLVVKALPNYRLYLEFSEGAKGEVDLSNLAGKGVFEAFIQPGFFEKVHIGSHREIKWNDEVELCPDSLYLKLTGKTPKQLFPKLRHEQPHVERDTWLKAFGELQRSLGLTPAKAAEWQANIVEARR